MILDEEDSQMRAAAMQNASAIQQARENAEANLARERERLRITLSSIGDAVISTDTECRINFVNRVAESLTGWQQDEALGRPLRDVFRVIDEFSRQPEEDPVTKAFAEGKAVAQKTHTILIARDGTERPIDESAALMRDESGKSIGGVLVFRDVTEQRKADELKSRLAAIVESSDDAIVGKTLDGIIRTWNTGAERIFGYSAAEAIGQPITLIIPPERLDEERSIIDRLVRGERIEHFETVRLRKDGHRRDISITISPLVNSEGRIIGASKIARDITDRKCAMEAVRFLADAGATIAEFAGCESALRKIATLAVRGFADVCIVDMVDETGRRLVLADRNESCDDGIPEAFGAIAQTEAGLQEILSILHTHEPEVLFDLCKDHLVQIEPERLARLREWGIRSYLRVALHSHGRYAGALALLSCSTRRRFGYESLKVLHDLAERLAIAIENSRLYRQLQEQDRRKDEFLATLAHELRNPLGPLQNGMQILGMVLKDNQRTAHTLHMMGRQLGNMVRLVDDLIDMARVSSGKIVLRREKVELKSVVENAVETVRQSIEEAGHRLFLELPPEPLFFDADYTRLVQVLSNLLHNAAKYTSYGGQISLSARRDVNDAVIRVADNGIGIPAEMLTKIFDMFTQVGSSLERSQGGLGIGLTLVKRLVEMHGGTARAESAGLGKGSTFLIRLPLALEPTKAVQPAEKKPTYAAAPFDILVVDDNEDAAESMAELLRIKGHGVLTAHDGPAALRLLGSFHAKLVLLDLGLPGMNGFEVAQRIRENAAHEDVTLVALTGWGQEDDRRRSKKAGFDYHITKPAAMDVMEKIILSVARKSQR